MKEFTGIPVTHETRDRVKNMRYDLRVDSMDAVVQELLDNYDQQ